MGKNPIPNLAKVLTFKKFLISPEGLKNSKILFLTLLIAEVIEVFIFPPIDLKTPFLL